LKQRVSIERAAEMLGIKLTKSGPQLRGPCPICKAGGDRAFVVTPAKGLLLLRRMREGRRRDHDGGERPQLFASRSGRVSGR
jgi:hypothetical protein